MGGGSSCRSRGTARAGRIMSTGTALLVVDGLHGLTELPAVLDVVPAERPRPVALSRDAVLEKLRAWEADYAAGQAPATLKALRSDFNRYLAWCEGTNTVPLPLSVDGLVAYVNNVIDRGRKRKTIDRYLFTLSTVHDAAGLPNPVKNPRFRLKFKAAIKRLVAYNRNVATPAEALTRDDIDKMLASLDLERMVSLRNAALLSLAADTLCRESELVRVRVESFVHNPVSGEITLDVGASKANPEGLPDHRYVSPETWALLERWCARAGVTRGFLFVAIAGRKKSQLSKLAASDEPVLRLPMNPKEVARIFKSLALKAGLGDRAAGVSGHSTRIGSANELACAGEDPRAIAAAGGWKDLKQVMHYTQASRAGVGAMARLRKRRQTGAAEDSAA